MTQNRLLDIAIREFGAKGLEGASTRGIAAAAGTAMSAITYHYGGKEGLYLAAAARIAELMRERVGESPVPEATVPDDPVAAREGIVRLLLRMVDTMAGPDSEAWSMFIVREQMHPTAAFDRIYAGSMGAMVSRLARLIEIATAAPPRIACIATMTLFGQTVVLRASRAMVLRALDADHFPADDLAAIKARIAANTHAILDRLSAESREHS